MAIRCGPGWYHRFSWPIQVGSVAVARLHRVPLAGPVLEPAPPLGLVRAMASMARPVLLDEPEASLGEEAESLGIVVHGPTVGRGSDALLRDLPEVE